MKSYSLTLVIFLLLPTLLIASSPQTIQKPKLRDFSYNKYSQWGEDGIIEKIFNIIGTTSKIAIEFGANDGFYFSNTALLWSTQGWHGVLIEGNKNDFPTLVRNTQSFNCLPISEYIGIEEHSNLEAILKKYNITDQIDLLSIDIDGNDYYIFDSLKTLHPRVIIVEHNATLPATLDLYQPYDPASTSQGFGCSVAALNRIAESKGYKLVCITDTNSFFVQKELFHLFDGFETSLREIQLEHHLKYLVSTYRGTYLIVGPQKHFSYNITTQLSPNALLGSAYMLNIPGK